MPAKKKSLAFKPTFETMHQLDVPQSRNGKHRKIVEAILEDVDNLAPGEAVKVPIRALGDTKENVRAALSRESKKRKKLISTAADADHLYVWQHKN
jgi:predicted DNA-binding antitoxin AbrB/MazE fold protein